VGIVGDAVTARLIYKLLKQNPSWKEKVLLIIGLLHEELNALEVASELLLVLLGPEVIEVQGWKTLPQIDFPDTQPAVASHCAPQVGGRRRQQPQKLVGGGDD